MISIEEIKKYYPDLKGFDRNILREYLQCKILDIIFKNKISAKLSFLGGTAIKICYGGSRFSEDLDFDNFGLTKREFNHLCKQIKKGLEYEGYTVETRIVFKEAFRCYIKIPKLLYSNQLSNLEAEKLIIQVDIAPHSFKYKPDNFLLQKFDIFRRLNVTPVNIILSQKVGAILGRRRAKGRDFYDLVYLMGITDFNFNYLKSKLGIKDRAALKKRILSAVKNLNFKQLGHEVQPFLIKPDDIERIIRFREYIEQEL